MKKRSTKYGIDYFGKIKTQHTIIEGLRDILQKIALIDEIKSVIPGRISQRGNSERKSSITITTPTQSGLKALGKSNGTTQELFIVTNEPDIVREKMNKIKG